MPFPKPPSRARVKATQKRLAASDARAVYRHVTERDKGRCRACGHFGIMHRHHIVYRSHGGLTTPENVCLLCGGPTGCHTAVHAGRVRITGSAEGELLFERKGEGERHATV